MDKQTLSNYGWIVICILVLSVMIAMATPFGKFIAEGVKSTTQGLFDVNQKAFNNVGFGQIADQEFEEHYSGDGAGGGAQASAPGATFSKYVASPGCHSYAHQHTDSCYTTGTNTLTWDELKLAENGTKYGYNASAITDTSIGHSAFYYCTSLTSIDFSGCTSLTSIGGNAFYYCTSLTSIDLPDSLTSIDESAFRGCTSLTSIDLSGCTSLTSIGSAFVGCTSLTSIDLPDSLTSIDGYAFQSCTNLTSITFDGTVAQWKAKSFGANWNGHSSITQIICNDGTIAL